MGYKIALAGNPNCGKTTMFNDLTGSSQYVGNWPGVTVEKKEGRLKGNKDVTIIDLPGIYSLSPYTLEEVVSRNYLLNEKPDAIVNLVDGTNLERNLYLTTQIVELGLPVVVALNMMDLVNKNGDKIDTAKLSAALGCEVVETSALKGTGIKESVNRAVAMAKAKKVAVPQHTFNKTVEGALSSIAELTAGKIGSSQARWLAIKVFERDEKVMEAYKFSADVMSKLNRIIEDLEKELDDDSESIITNERYTYITGVMRACVHKNKRAMSSSDKIDRIVTNRFLALPIFALVMFIVYFVAMGPVGTVATDWANDGVFGDGWHLFGISGDYNAALEEFETATAEAEESGQELLIEEPDPSEYGVWVPGVPVLINSGLEAAEAPDWLNSLVLDGIVGGVGAVLGFVPQMLILFIFLAFLEDCGYMARIAFIMDRIFRKFGLSGKSFIPMLISSGCGVPGVMATKTIENEKDRRMTIMTTTFIPCGAKLPVIALIAGTMMGGAPWMAPVMYFIGVAAVILSGIILKKTRMFAGDPAPFVMELPQYHMPGVKGVVIHMWERSKAFIIKAGTVIFVACGLIWFLSSFGISDGSFGMVEQESSFLAVLGKFVAPVFAPLGFGSWQAAVATISGLVAKENVVGTFGVLFGMADAAETDPGLLNELSVLFPTALAGMSFLLFNMLCAPCFAAIGAIKREMASGKWTAFAIAYQTTLAYAVALMVYQIGSVFTGAAFGAGTAVAIVVALFILFMMFRKGNTNTSIERPVRKASATL